jgi:thiol:disulfide interchange protein DsbD
LLASLLLLFRSYGHEAGWGFQLQQPLFVGFLAALLFAFALSFFGVFEFGLSLTAYAGDAERKAGNGSAALAGSFFSGVLATAVATPCTGPFMAPALGYAATLPAFWALLIFTALGIGMATPYLFLSAYPKLLNSLPRPGPWMTTFKHLMGFLLLATVLWLVDIFASETGEDGMNMMLIALFVLAFGCWIFGRYCTPVSPLRSRRIGVLFAGLCVLMASYIVLQAGEVDSENTKVVVKEHHGGWETFTAERFEELRKEGKPVFIDFTAKWCMICQANHLMLSTSEVTKKFDDHGVIKMKADWTRHDPAITTMLRKFGRNGVPLYVLYGSDPLLPPEVLPQLLTPGVITQAIENLTSPIASD